MFGPGRARVQNGCFEDEKHATFPGTLRSQMPRNCILLSGKFKQFSYEGGHPPCPPPVGPTARLTAAFGRRPRIHFRLDLIPVLEKIGNL